jgi:hypothetical protein
MEGMHKVLNGCISSDTADNAASLIVGYTYWQRIGGRYPEMKTQLELALSPLISLAKRSVVALNYIHVIRLIINQPQKYYRDHFTADELAMFESAEPDANLIALLNSCLCLIDPIPHVAGKDSHLNWLPRTMVKPDAWLSAMY